jgi:hypothetical protein
VDNKYNILLRVKSRHARVEKGAALDELELNCSVPPLLERQTLFQDEAVLHLYTDTHL